MPAENMPRETEASSLYLRPKNNQKLVTSSSKIRCYVGKEWKPRSEFSNRQLEKFVRSKASPQHSTISCRYHSIQQRRELQCEGPCGRWRPIEDFSRSTRGGGSKAWCLDCTEWQLSLEPGFTPYVPPNEMPGPEEVGLLEDAPQDAPGQEEQSGERVEQASVHELVHRSEANEWQWIQENPSEAGDYDRVEIATQPSIIDSASEISGPSLLDDNISELGSLPQALNAINLSQVGLYDQPRSSYASMASSRATTPPVAPQTRPPRAAGGMLGLLPDNFDARSQHSSSMASFITDSNAKTTSQGQSAASTTNTFKASRAEADSAWMENEFLHVEGRQASEADSTWARPPQRRTDLTTPRYVVNGNTYDIEHQHQREIYADVDDDESEDEC